MAGMNWPSILSAAKLLGTAVVIVGVIAIVIIGQGSQARHRIAKYNRTGRLIDLIKIFSRW
jgi:hypothetical protein